LNESIDDAADVVTEFPPSVNWGSTDANFLVHFQMMQMSLQHGTKDQQIEIQQTSEGYCDLIAGRDLHDACIQNQIL